jgi:plastocyanin
LVAVVLLAIPACGGEGGQQGGSSPPPSAAGQRPVATIDLDETEYRLDPANPTVSRPGVVVINATNRGREPHNIEVEGPSGEKELARDLAPGKSGTLQVNLDKPGRYTWYCPVEDHKDEGMEGTITVR